MNAPAGGTLTCKPWSAPCASKTPKPRRAPRRSCTCAGPISQDSSFSEDKHEALRDWRSFRANLIALEKANFALQQELAPAAKTPQSWVHELILPEEGCLLLGRMTGLGLFTRSVVLLCHHDEQGSSGYMLNMPLKQHLVDLSIMGELAECLRKKTLLYGGPCSRSAADVLHTCKDVAGASELIQGVSHGGLEQINNMARLGQLPPKQVQLVVGCAGWDPGQLLAEVQAGCWFVLAASDDVLKTCIFGEKKTLNVVKHHLMWQQLLSAAGIDPSKYQ